MNYQYHLVLLETVLYTFYNFVENKNTNMYVFANFVANRTYPQSIVTKLLFKKNIEKRDDFPCTSFRF